MMDWDHKDLWRVPGENFLVEVTRHTEKPSPFSREFADMFGEGPHRWAVYAYVYPKHPLFAGLNERPGSLSNEVARSLPLHAGPSLVRLWHAAGGEVTSVQVGADYHHLHDESYTFMATREEAAAVFADAERLWQALTDAIAAGQPTGAPIREPGAYLLALATAHAEANRAHSADWNKAFRMALGKHGLELYSEPVKVNTFIYPNGTAYSPPPCYPGDDEWPAHALVVWKGER